MRVTDVNYNDVDIFRTSFEVLETEQYYFLATSVHLLLRNSLSCDIIYYNSIIHIMQPRRVFYYFFRIIFRTGRDTFTKHERIL